MPIMIMSINNDKNNDDNGNNHKNNNIYDKQSTCGISSLIEISENSSKDTSYLCQHFFNNLLRITSTSFGEHYIHIDFVSISYLFYKIYTPDSPLNNVAHLPEAIASFEDKNTLAITWPTNVLILVHWHRHGNERISIDLKIRHKHIGGIRYDHLIIKYLGNTMR